MSIDGRVLFKAKVTASETYNTALEHHLTDRLGVRFTERPNPDPRKRPVREIVGVDPALNERWSARRKVIVVRQGELATRFQQASTCTPGSSLTTWTLSQTALTKPSRDSMRTKCGLSQLRSPLCHSSDGARHSVD